MKQNNNQFAPNDHKRTPWLHSFFIGLLALLASTLAACNVKYPPNGRPTLYSTISADGDMVATLANIGTDNARLRVMDLRSDARNWQELAVPKYTTSIRFGMQGRDLLLTYNIGEQEKAVLAKWDMNSPAQGPQQIYAADGLVFPVEVAPGEYLVRACYPTPQGRCHSAVGVVWDLVKDQKLIHRYSAPVALNYSQPNVVQGQGFYWMKVPGEYQKEEAFPGFKRFAFPGKQEPEVQLRTMSKDSTSLYCDHTSTRCLRSFIANFGEKYNPKSPDYVYAAEVLYGGTHCPVSGVAGYYDEISLTPNGNAAVISLASGYDQTRHVVVIHFKPGQCEPQSVEHIHFNKGE
ncbi:MAG: hypothetical protein PHH58_17760 [Rhodoferax sp.]|nr:hypothetical protein [Rhodoferax sp.]